MDNNSKVKLNRFERYYPEEKLTLVDSKAYRVIEKKYKERLKHWES